MEKADKETLPAFWFGGLFVFNRRLADCGEDCPSCNQVARGSDKHRRKAYRRCEDGSTYASQCQPDGSQLPEKGRGGFGNPVFYFIEIHF